jgi:glycosyltransferase involved in cell wall biosynthesis
LKVVIATNTTWNLLNFRTGLISALVDSGHEVLALAPLDAYSKHLSVFSCRFVHLPMDNKGTNPVRDALLLWRFFCVLRRERPDVFLGYTIKPNIYGSLAAHFLGIKVINNIAGLGSVFIQDGWLVRLVRGLYKLALYRSSRVFFQNKDDHALFVNFGLVVPEASDLVPGSGIDLSRFLPVLNRPVGGHPFRFLLVARMLRDKGIREYVEAAALLRPLWPNVEFALLGFLDSQNPTAITQAQMDAWVQQGNVIYLGSSDDVREQMASADCVVLPSYREGTPRSLLEAAAMGRPIVTTDAVGCREVVDHGKNGFLCKIKDIKDLALKMECVLKLEPSQREAMGALGREKMVREFDEKLVINKYLSAIEKL